ncbi:hypothetical protein PInf_015684 [Phytophthora infestans]|nr:hypothetical protein PInf_015684 [Phytophthora infestans]
MSSKLEYLQRYMSGGGGDAIDGEKKKKKKVKKTKKTKSTALGTRVVDADDTWEQSAPNREAIEKKWEMDAAEDEQPLVVAADGEELVDPQDLPVYVDSDKYLDEFKSGKTHLKKNEDEDMSPPRKRTAGRSKTDVSSLTIGTSPTFSKKVVEAELTAQKGVVTSSQSWETPLDVTSRPDTKKEGTLQDREAHNESRTAVQSPSPADVKTKFREPKKKSDDKEEKKAGLFTAAEFEHQRKVAARRKDILRGVDASEMGANAETVYRDKRGRKLDMLNEMVRQQEVLDGKRKREEREEYEWGTGEVQKRERKSQHELLEQMKKTPFARHEDDEELDRKRRERVRAFDPMNSKVFQEDPLAEGKTKTKKSKKDKKSKKKPRYAGPPAPPNRFGIQPGYRWDGVVRGTNWEEKIMMRQNANAAVSEEAYKYAVADM